MVEGEELDAGMDRLGGDFGVAEAAYCRVTTLVSLSFSLLSSPSCQDHDRQTHTHTHTHKSLSIGSERGEGRDKPGMMYVRLRRALSICDTWPAFLEMKSSYSASQRGGRLSTWATAFAGRFACGSGSGCGCGIMGGCARKRPGSPLADGLVVALSSWPRLSSISTGGRAGVCCGMLVAAGTPGTTRRVQSLPRPPLLFSPV